MDMLGVPRSLWNLYVDHLWYYKPDSWVHRIAYSFRILAILLIAPIVLLTCLDVASYVIARTLGVIEHTKASTSESDAGTDTQADKIPTINVQGSPRLGSDAYPSTPSSLSRPSSIEGIGNLKLSGFDQFSPIPSQPASPSSSRRDLHADHQRFLTENTDDSERTSQSIPSPSSSESYAVLERDSESEKDGEELRLRRRTNPGTAVGGRIADA